MQQLELRPADITVIDFADRRHHHVSFDENPETRADHEDPWQFRNFLFTP